MESIRGKQAWRIGAATLAAQTVGYQDIWVDIGTGDGRYVRHVARECPAWFVIGVDACRENLRHVSRDVSRNALFIIANALTLPRELHGLATWITINFPWGSLLAALVEGDPALFDGLLALARPGAILEIRLNRSALMEAGQSLEREALRVAQAVQAWGFAVVRSEALGADVLRACPTTWSKRLAGGRDPSGWYLSAVRGVACGEKADIQSARARMIASPAP